MTQFDSLKTYLSTFVSVPPMEWFHFVKLLGLKRVPKDSLYYRQGEKFDEIGFVVKGLLYNYYTMEDGKYLVKKFLFEGNPVTCYSDLIRGTPASFSCKALEDCLLITLKYKDLEELYKRHACWERLGRISAEVLFADKEKREFDFLSKDAKGLYASFVQDTPDLVNRVPQYLIAAYIGVSAVSLSRIRSEN